MKININNKEISINLAIILIIILILAIIIGIYYIKKSTNKTVGQLENKIKSETSIIPEKTKSDDAYIDIWRDTSMDSDIDLYSRGTGDNEEIYLGAQPVHYLIYKNGEIKSSVASAFENKKTGKREPPTVESIGTVSQDDLEKIESELKDIIENNKSDSNSLQSRKWYIKINGKRNTVTINPKTEVLDKYIGE